jgi:hypothetical protein
MNNNRNISVLRSKCYARGVSMYNSNTLEPKTLKRIYKECTTNNITKFTDANWRNYGVPPKSERARAIRNANPGMSVKDALVYASDPFFSFKNPRYMPDEPLPGRPNTLSRSHGHNVWTILPTYFPGPNKPKPKPKPKSKRVTAPIKTMIKTDKSNKRRFTK